MFNEFFFTHTAKLSIQETEPSDSFITLNVPSFTKNNHYYTIYCSRVSNDFSKPPYIEPIILLTPTFRGIKALYFPLFPCFPRWLPLSYPFLCIHPRS